MILLTGSLIWLVSSKKSQTPVLVFMFSLNGFIHMILDSVPHKIFWLAPFSFRGFSLDSLLKSVAPSIIDEHPYWSYSIEAVIIFWALYLFIGNLRKIDSSVSTDRNEMHTIDISKL
jgi:hypothetical protein